MSIIVFPPVDLFALMRSMLPFAEPIVIAVAGACGAGLLIQIGLDIALKLARQALAGRP